MSFRGLHKLFSLTATAAGTVLALVAGSVPAAASTLPLPGEVTAFLNSTLVWNYDTSPAGANVPCTPSAAHPYPVILTEGTFARKAA